MSKYYIGVDIGGSTIKFGLFDENKKLLGKHPIVTPKFSRDPEKSLISYICKSADDYIATNVHGLTKKNLAGIGFAVPGPVVKNNVLRAVNINWKKHYDIVAAVKKHFGKKIKVSVGNDANVAALGEYKETLKGKYKSMCMFTLGTGVGVGIIIDGRVIEGRSGIAGELSHLKVDFSRHARKCNCGNTGCLETVASGAGIAKVYNGMWKTNRAKGAQDVIRLAKAKDKKALKALEYSLDYLSSVMAMVMLVYEPDVIMIGGGVSNEGTFVTDILERQLKNKVFITKNFPKIMLAKLKNDAGIYGTVAEL